MFLIILPKLVHNLHINTTCSDEIYFSVPKYYPSRQAFKVDASKYLYTFKVDASKYLYTFKVDASKYLYTFVYIIMLHM